MYVVELAVYTSDNDGEKRYSVNVNGSPMMAPCRDWTVPETVARNLYDGSKHARLVRWDGDRGVTTVIAEK